MSHAVKAYAACVILGAILALMFLGYRTKPVRADGVVTADGGQPTELCPFSPGWNLVVLNGTPSDLPSCVGVVWRYEAMMLSKSLQESLWPQHPIPPDDRWFFWGRDNAPYWNDLESFDITKGYWVWAQY